MKLVKVGQEKKYDQGSKQDIFLPVIFFSIGFEIL